MKKNILVLLLLFLSFSFAGCGNDGDSQTDPNPAVVNKPNWKIDLAGADSPPTWETPDYSLYGQTMTFSFALNPILAQYASGDDLFAAFVNNSCRALGQPSVNVEAEVPTAMGGFVIGVNESTEGKVSLAYYCKNLHRVFRLDDYMAINPFIVPTQSNGAPYSIPFELNGNESLSVHFVLTMPAEQSFDQTAGDEMAILVNGQCRSMLLESTDKKITLDALCKAGEVLTVAYYNAEKKGIYHATSTYSVTGNKTIEDSIVKLSPVTKQ